MKYLPASLGLILSLIITFQIDRSYQYQTGRINLTQLQSTPGYHLLESLDHIIYDLKFRIRGNIQSDAPVALLAVDDRTLDEVGRWPFSREIMARMLRASFKNGAKSIGMDVIWSEEEKDLVSQLSALGIMPQDLPADVQKKLSQAPRPDESLSSVIEDFKTSFVLGSFSEAQVNYSSPPYTDYCRNEAFLLSSQSGVSHLGNTSFVVIDPDDQFEEIAFTPLFKVLFQDLREKNLELILTTYFNSSPFTQLNSDQKRRLELILTEMNLNYCDRWLSETDEYIETSYKFFESLVENHEAVFKMVNSREGAALADFFKKQVHPISIPQYQNWLPNVPQIQSKAQYTGAVLATPDEDGKIRKLPLFFRSGNRSGLSYIPSLALQTYLAGHPKLQAQVLLDWNHSKTEKLPKSIHFLNTETQQGVFSVPISPDGKMNVLYAGRSKSFYYIPAFEMLSDSPKMWVERRVFSKEHGDFRVIPEQVDKASFLKDRFLIFGVTAIGGYDLRVTPLDNNFPGPEIHLTALANLLDQTFLKPWFTQRWPPGFIGLALMLGLTSLVAFSGALTGILSFFIFMCTIFLVDYHLFTLNQITSLPKVGVGLLLIFLVLTTTKYFTEERKKKELRSVFNKYVAPSVVNEILKSPENIELGGKKQRVSVFFSDVRGFTTISEKLDPHKLTEILNEYLTPMTDIVFKNKGTLDKYMGDAVMAFFGAPLSLPNTAEWACRCALESVEKLKELQQDFDKRGLPMIDLGIGINTAEVNVGNMGSKLIRSYTVIGDGVNLASRLEGANKEYGTRILVSEFTYAEAKELFIFRQADLVKVKGKTQPIKVFELIAERKNCPPDKLKVANLFSEGIGLYFSHNFEAAKRKFEACLALDSTDFLSKLYSQRCESYLQHPPQPDWDGVFEMKNK